MTHIIKISGEGKDVKSATVDDLIAQMNIPTALIRERKQIVVSTTGGEIVESYTPYGGSNTYVHGYNYIPQMIAFVTTSNIGYHHPSSYINVPNMWLDTVDDMYPLYEDFQCYTTKTTITCKAYNYAVLSEEPVYNCYAFTYTFDILIFMEEALTS